MASSQTISEAIGDDHQSFDVYCENMKSSKDEAEQVRWRNQLTWTLARHAISEELTLYPAMEKWLGDEGVQLAKTDKEQHQAVCKHLVFSQNHQALLISITGEKLPLRIAGYDSIGPEILATS